MRPKLNGVPQAAQKARSAIEDERNVAGVPLGPRENYSRGISAKDANGAPAGLLAHAAMADADLGAAAPTAQSGWRRTGSRRSGPFCLFPSCLLHPPPGFLQHRQRVAAGKDEIADAGRAQRGLLLAGPPCQIDMAWRRRLEGPLRRPPRVPHRPCRTSTGRRVAAPDALNAAASAAGSAKPCGVDRLDAAAGLKEAPGGRWRAR